MIEVENVAVRLGRNQILEQISMSVGAGRFIGLVGPNGAGKSTLLRTIGGIIRPESGTVSVAGTTIHELSARKASRLVAFVPQTTLPSFDFTVREVVEMGRTPYYDRFKWTQTSTTDYVDRALKRTETEFLADRPISSVSGGERQRVVLARALAQDAPILLLDEPTASLDINHQVKTFELLVDLVKSGKTVITAIHDLNLAAHYCDSLVLLSNGRIHDDGSPVDVLTESNLRYSFDTRAIVSRHPVTGAVYVTALPEAIPEPSKGRVHVIGGGGSASRLLYVLTANGYDVTVGVLNEGDSDLETARSLGLDTVEIEPFASIDDRARTILSTYISEADVTVIADIEVGMGNLSNLELASSSDRLVLVEKRPIADRNFAGEPGRECYNRIRRRSRIVGPDSVVQAVAGAMEDEGSSEQENQHEWGPAELPESIERPPQAQDRDV